MILVCLFVFFLFLPWQGTSLPLSFNLNFELHIHGIYNALLHLVGVQREGLSSVEMTQKAEPCLSSPDLAGVAGPGVC